MAKQVGIFPLEGRIENITFYKTGDGYSVQKVKGVSKERVATDPAFIRTRENMAEFTRAANAGKLLRSALEDAINGSKDKRMPNRLSAVMLKAVHLDQTSDRGLRNVLDGELSILEGFEFNKVAPLSTTFDADSTATVNRVTGECNLTVPAFLPEKKLKTAPGATHYRFVLVAAEVDFELQKKESRSVASAYLPVAANQPTGLLDLETKLTPGSTHPIFLAVTIEFVQETNGKMYPIKSGAFNACAVAKVDTGI